MTAKLSPQLHRLERLALRYRGGLTSYNSGKRLTNKHGTSLEFADYRPYLPGDDPRRVDWSLYGRSHRLYTRLNRSEVDATVNFLIDGSGSMDWGTPHKGERALELTLSLAYLSLQAYDRVSVAVGAKAPTRYLPPLYGKGSFTQVLHFLEEQEFDQEGDLNTLLYSYYASVRPHQLTVILSDFLSPGGYEQGLLRLLAARQNVIVFHLVSPDEVEPEERGPLQLVDTETKVKKEVDVDPYLLQRYRDGVHRHGAQIQEFCRIRGIHYSLYNTEQNPVDFLLANATRLFRTL
ncbi:MAG: DUF58 domain-containing protein [Firmicutes bacterium]|nr:DUF58 domain-containing protein [Bacillota bacterium]